MNNNDFLHSNVGIGNTSGQGKNAIIPKEIGKFNIGAFLLPFIWGFFNGIHWGIMILVLVLSIVIPFLWVGIAFVFGFQGNVWAWQNKRWDNVEHFKKVQSKWAIATLIVLVVMFVIPIMLMVLPSLMVDTSSIHKQMMLKAENKLQESLLMQEAIGERYNNLTSEGIAQNFAKQHENSIVEGNKITIRSGVIYTFEVRNGAYYVTIDANGKKGPNKIGQDQKTYNLRLDKEHNFHM